MSNILLVVTSNTIINKLKDKGIKLVYPLSSFCVGLDTTFELSDIKTDGYLLINRILDSKDMDRLEVIINNLDSNIKGIIFEDIGVVELLKNTKLERILLFSHFNTNYLSINEYFNYVDEIIVSSDITEEEIDKIIKNSKKDISLFVFGLISSFYSRRLLLKAHSIHNNIDYKNKMDLINMDKKFIAYENEYGTVLYHYPYYNGLRLKGKKAKYYFYAPLFLNDEDVLNVLDGNIDSIPCDEGFLDTKTIYRVKEVK